jgi:uncharacterized metal-binding protein
MGRKKKDKKQSENVVLTNNFTANLIILVIGNISLLALLLMGKISSHMARMFSSTQEFLAHLLIFNISYFLTSYWFSPDLDVSSHRPGQGTFPFKAILSLLHKTRKLPFLGYPSRLALTLLDPVHLLMNFFWRFFWQPFAGLFTHRGAVHWPIWGTQLKIIYMAFCYWLLINILALVSLSHALPFSLSNLPFYDKGFFQLITDLYHLFMYDPLVRTAWVSAMIADICHSAVDYIEAAELGRNFVPPAMIAPRGLFIKAFKIIVESYRNQK